MVQAMLCKSSKNLGLVLFIVFLMTGHEITSANASPLDSKAELVRPVFTTSTGNNTVQLNKTTKLTLSEEFGDVVAAYSTLTPNICSVSPEGVVTGVHGGTCSILASISGSGRYLVPTSAVVILDVQELSPRNQNLNKASENMTRIVRRNGFFIITLDWDSRYSDKKVSLQLGIERSSGQISYRAIASLLLNSDGDGSITRKATYAKNLYLRALVNKQVMVTKKIQQ